jgi:hypothetical protein
MAEFKEKSPVEKGPLGRSQVEKGPLEKKSTDKSPVEKSQLKTITYTFGVLSIVLALLVVLMAFNAIPTANSNRPARLVNVGLGGNDLPSQHVLRLSGYVCNVGVDPAYHTQLHVVGVYTTGGEAMNTYVNIGNGGIIYGSDSVKVSVDVSYSADGLGSWTLTPVWSSAP